MLDMTSNTHKNSPSFDINADLFYSEQFQKLSKTAKILYIDMGITSESKGNFKNDFTFPRSIYCERYSRDAFQTAKDQLVNAGFIMETKYSGEETHYSLSSKWCDER